MTGDAKIHSALRVLELNHGGALVIPTDNLTDSTKSLTDPLGLTMWASKVDTEQWNSY